MVRSKHLEIDRRVGIAMSVLTPSQKAVIIRITRSPQAFATAAAVPGRVQQMRTSGQPLYKMKVSPSLRLIYTMVGETIYVVDLVERATLAHFAASRSPKKPTKAVAKKSKAGVETRKARDIVEK